MTIAIVLLAATLGFQGQTVVQGGPPPKPVPQNAPATLPDTPQGRHVKAFIEAFNSGDNLHPNDAGYKAMGEAVELALFK